MLSLNGEFTIANFVEGVLDSVINPEETCIGIKVQEEYTYLAPEEYHYLFEDENDPEGMFDPIINERVYHNFLFYAPSNYVKVLYNMDNSMSIMSIFNKPLELVSDHDSAWRHDGFHLMKQNSNQVMDDLKDKVYRNLGLEISSNDVSSFNMIEQSCLFNINYQNFMKNLSMIDRTSRKLFYFKLDREDKTLNLIGTEECKTS